MSTIKSPKKLIEVALPLDDINEAATAEKNNPFLKEHPRNLHLWWARRPLAAARAVLFSQLVNDPGGERGYYKGKTKAQADQEREELFDIIRDLVKWENTNNEEVLNRAKAAIKKSWKETCELNKNHPQASELFNPEKLPAFHDPFAGGGALPLEAQRLGLTSYASDLNPVAVLINKAMIEIPPMFTNRKPIGPLPELEKKKPKLHEDWSCTKGLAEDIRRYGHWMKNEVFKNASHLYPNIKITSEIVQDYPELNKYLNKDVIPTAYIWARTVKSPNPAFSHIDVPLVRSFVLSNKKGKEAWIEPIVSNETYTFKVKYGKKPVDAISGTVDRNGGVCILSNTPMPFTYIREKGKTHGLGLKLMAVVCEGNREKIFLSPNYVQMDPINDDLDWVPNVLLPNNTRDFKTPNYGLDTFDKLFTRRQLLILAELNNAMNKLKQKVSDECNDQEYAKALVTYLSLAITQYLRYYTTFAVWNATNQNIAQAFGRQAIPMTWDFPESNPFEGTLTFETAVGWISNAIRSLPATSQGTALQQDAQNQDISQNKVISTDPPYYDNIGYADLSDFFYVWLRKNLKDTYPDLFITITVPKESELVATPYRHGSKEKAEKFFLDGMTKTMENLVQNAHAAFPVTIYYAFKQSETNETGTMSTGWETFLAAVIQAGFTITGTWPMRTERPSGVKTNMNALASSIILVCRKRDDRAESISRREFQRELKDEMPEALEAMIGGKDGASPIAPVDLAQAAIGPGMGIYSKYEAVLNQDGTNMSVHDALILINKAVDEYFSDAEGDLDEDSRFAVDWFMQYGFGKGAFGEADTLARAKGTSVDLVKEAGIIESGQGKVRLLKWEEYPTDWDPTKDNRTPVWEAAHHMIRVLNQKGEGDAGALLARMPQRTEPIRQLAYRLYTLCERKGWAEIARAYNELIASWHAIVEESYNTGRVGETKSLFGDEL